MAKIPNQYPMPTAGLMAPEEKKFPIPLANAEADKDSWHIDALKKSFRDMARPNLFRVHIFPPETLKAEWDEDLSVLVKSASFPSIEIQPIELEHAGNTLYIPSNKIINGELTVTFYNDVDFKLKTLFHIWQRYACSNWQYNIDSIPTLSLGGEIGVYQYDSKHDPMFGTWFRYAWPKSISEIALSHESESQIEEFSVTFAYSNQEIMRKQ